MTNGNSGGPSSIKIRQLYISSGHNYFGHHGELPGKNPMIEVLRIECLAGRGIRGDRFFDHQKGYKGQITFFAWETCKKICAALEIEDRSPAMFRRNVITVGTDLNTFIGVDFWIQGVHFRGIEECRPCYWMDQAVAPGACTLLKGHGGLRAEILTNGHLSTEAVC